MAANCSIDSCNYSVKNNEISQIKNSFPELECNIEQQKIFGKLLFHGSYNKNNEKFYYNASRQDEKYIFDSYDIEIDFQEGDFFNFPKIYEISNKIKTFADLERISESELHINPDKSCCLGIFPHYKYISAVDFINHKVVSFFYWQSFRKIFGYEPWGTHLHSIEGLLEDIRAIQPTGRNQLCLCQSGKKYKHCCLSKRYFLEETLKSFNLKYNPTQK